VTPPPLPDHPKISFGADRTLLLNFGQYGQQVEVACFSGDGARVLTVKDVGVAQVRETASGQAVGEVRPTSPLEGNAEAAPNGGPFRVFIEAAAMNVRGDLALLGLNDGTAGVFAVDDGRRLSVLHRPEARPHERWEMIRAVDWSLDGSLLAVGFYGGVGVWTPDGRPIAYLEPPAQLCAPGPDDFRPALVTAVSISADNRYLFAGFANAAVVVWDLETRRDVMAAAEHAWRIIRVQYAGDRLVWATSGGTVWRAAEGAGAADKILHTGQRWSYATFAPDGASVLVRRHDGGVSRWSLDGSETILAGPIQDGFRAGMTGGLRDQPVGFWGDGGTFHFADGFDAITLQSAAGRQRFQRASLNPGADFDLTSRLDALWLSPAQDRAVTIGWSPGAELWDTRTGKLVARLDEWQGAVAFAPDGALVAFGAIGHGGQGAPRDIQLVDPQTGRLVATLSGHRHQVLALAFAPDGSWLLSAGLDHKVCRWEKGRWLGWRCGRQTEIPDLDPYEVAVLPDERCLIFRRDCIDVRRDLDDLVAVIPCGYEFQRRWAVSPDLQRITVTTGRSAVTVYRLADGGREASPQPAFARPFFLPDALGDATAGAFLWPAPGGPYLYTGDGPRGWATPLALSADRGSIVIPCRERAVILAAEPAGTVRARVPFTGRLRGARITADRVLLVNEEGRVFSSPVR
jgi:WD40 repeat protein